MRGIELQSKLGNVDTQMNDGEVILTHTCYMRAGLDPAQSTVRVWNDGVRARAPNGLPKKEVLVRQVLTHATQGPMAIGPWVTVPSTSFIDGRPTDIRKIQVRLPSAALAKHLKRRSK